MWPMILDYSRDECRRMLRRMELEAYSSVVSALRAQGEFNKEKKQILQQLCQLFSITIERHQAEIRRAANDEKLNTIAYNLSQEVTCSEWAAEGRRLIPLMPRLVPQNAMTSIANVAANIQATKNETATFPTTKLIPETSKETPTGKRKRAESNGSIETNKVKVTPNAKNAKMKTNVSQSMPLSSSTPRVVFMTTSASGLRTMTSTASTTSPVDIKAAKTITTLAAGTSHPISTSTNRVFATKATFPQQLVVFPGSSSGIQKTITIPMAQSVKLPHGSSASATLVYQQNTTTAATLKSIPGTFTIQTFKPSQGNKLQTPNLIIMPASKSPLCQVSKPVATIVGSNAKGLTRHLNAAEVKIVTTETSPKPSTSSVIEIQASAPVLQNIMKSRQINKDIIDLVQKAVNSSSQAESHEKPTLGIVEETAESNVIDETNKE